MKTIVCIPTYNERENIESIVSEVLKYNVHVLIIDDNSPDGTGAIADMLAKNHEKSVFVLHRQGKEGLGKAYIAGFKWAINQKYDLIFEMDADFSHQPKYIPNFLKLAKSYDLVLGSRYIKDGGTFNWSKTREMISKCGSFYARTILGLKIRDLTGGFKCFHRHVLESIDLDSVDCTGYAFQIELTYRAHLIGFKIVETPIIFYERAHGVSKMSKNIVFEAVSKVFNMRRIKYNDKNITL